MNIEHISYRLGGHAETVQSLQERGTYSLEESLIYQKLMGLSKVPREYRLNHHEQLNDLVNQFLSERDIKKSKVKYIFYTHTAEFTTPHDYFILHKIRSQFKFKNSFVSGSSLLKCASAFQFFQLSNALYGNIRLTEYIILLIADLTFTTILQHIPGSTILGDAASLVLIGNRHNRHHYMGCMIKIDDRFSRGAFGDQQESLLFQEIYVDTLCGVIQQLLHQYSLSIKDIAQIFPHNVNTISWHLVLKKLGASTQQLYNKNIRKTAHCFGSDPFINLKDGIDEGVIQRGDYYLLVTVGLGASFAAMLFCC